MRAHLRYLRYVLLHKLYVFRAGVVIGGYSIPWLWRLLVHDLSKFSRAEWTPYVCMFYGEPADQKAAREVDRHLVQYHEPSLATDTREHMIAERLGQIRAQRQRDFNAAWLHHIHANPHHWQHWILRQDNGTEITLVQPVAVLNEMVADWIGAGAKVLKRPSMAECVGETIVWYAKAGKIMQLRADARAHVEMTLHALARHYQLDKLAEMVRDARTHQTVTLGKQ